MKLTRTSEIRGDETASYIVEKYKATTLGEVVEEVLKERPHEWGYISFNGSFVANRNKCEYADGKIKVDFPNKSVLNEPIYYVLGDGGWSRMDYEVLQMLYAKFINITHSKPPCTVCCRVPR